MAILKCKMCGGNLEVEQDMTVCECEYCGTKQTVPNVDNEKKITLFTRANRLRSANDFDKAYSIYESIVAEFSEEAEAYWGLVLCKYGIEYVDDPATGKKIPTCHRSSFESIMEDSDFEQALENADVAARRVYREEAKQIEEIRKGIIAVSSNEAPYDIFICYKETDENGDRTLDSVLAQDLYDALTDKGYRTFFARITLEDKLGQEYEPYIFAALNSARIMLAVGTDYEYYNAVWVKNEWSRFLKLMTKDKDKHLIPCYKGIDAYDMPKEFAKLQAQDLGKVGATQDLLRGIGKLLPKQEQKTVVVQTAMPDTSALVMRGQFALDDGDFVRAAEYFERALDQNPQDGSAYLGKVLAALRLSSAQQIDKCFIKLHDDKNFDRAIRFSDAATAQLLRDIRERAHKKYLIKCMTIGITKYAEQQAGREAENREQQRLEEEKKQERELEHKKVAYEIYKEIMNEQINKEIGEKTAAVRASYADRKESIRKEMEQRVEKVQSQRRELSKTRKELQDRRDSLGFFKRREKEILDREIAEISRRYSELKSDYEITGLYRSSLSNLVEGELGEIKRATQAIREANPIETLEDFKLDAKWEAEVKARQEAQINALKDRPWFAAARDAYENNWDHFILYLLPLLDCMEKRGPVTVGDMLNSHPRGNELNNQKITAFFREDGMRPLYIRKLIHAQAHFSISPEL